MERVLHDNGVFLRSQRSGLDEKFVWNPCFPNIMVKCCFSEAICFETLDAQLLLSLKKQRQQPHIVPDTEHMPYFLRRKPQKHVPYRDNSLVTLRFRQRRCTPFYFWDI